MASIRTQRRDRQMHMALMLCARRGDAVHQVRRFMDELKARVVAHVLAPRLAWEAFVCDTLQHMADSIERDFHSAEPDSAAHWAGSPGACGGARSGRPNHGVPSPRG